MKDFCIFLIGSVVLMPIVIFVFSGSPIGFVIGVIYLVVIIYSVKLFPKFWSKWLEINLYYCSLFEGRK